MITAFSFFIHHTHLWQPIRTWDNQHDRCQKQWNLTLKSLWFWFMYNFYYIFLNYENSSWFTIIIYFERWGGNPSSFLSPFLPFFLPSLLPSLPFFPPSLLPFLPSSLPYLPFSFLQLITIPLTKHSIGHPSPKSPTPSSICSASLYWVDISCQACVSPWGYRLTLPMCCPHGIVPGNWVHVKGYKQPPIFSKWWDKRNPGPLGGQ